MQDKIRLTNIQRMCFHDGPGIRTTVFMKGCSLHCPWCSNPENIKFIPEVYDTDGLKYVYGRDYSANDIADFLMKDRRFWEKNGGVTFSGGEALMQAEALQHLLKILKVEDVHIAVETALFVPEENVEKIMPFTDYFIVDVKILNKDQCREVLGGDLSVYKKNVETLYQAGKLKTFRVPCCPEYTCTEENKQALLDFFEQYRSVPVQIFEIHGLGEKKYRSLGLTMWKSRGMAEEELQSYCEMLVSCGISAEVIHL